MDSPEGMPPVTICAAFQAVRRLEAFTISNPGHRLGRFVEIPSNSLLYHFQLLKISDQ